jgi:hypothetical protein
MSTHTEYLPTGLFEPCFISKFQLKIFRFFSCILMIGIFVWNLNFEDLHPPYLFLTSWGVYITTLYFLSLSIHYILKGSEETPIRNNIYLCMLLICEAAFSLELFICIFYWIVLYPDDERSRNNTDIFLFSFSEHLISPVLILLDNIFAMPKYEKKHYLIPFTISILYAILNGYYALVENVYIYQVIDWQTGLSFAFIISAILLMTGTFYLGYRISLWKHAYKKKTSEEQELIQAHKN